MSCSGRFLIRVAMVAASAVLLGSPALAAQDSPAEWPNFRGPDGNGTSAAASPPVEFGPEQNLKWKVAIPGRGHSSPVVCGGRIYLMTAVDTGRAGAGRGEGDTGGGGEPRNPDRNPPSTDRPRREGPPGGRPPGGGGPPGGMNRAAPGTVHDFMVLCLDRATGATVWSKTVRSAVPHEGGHNTNTQCSASPVTDGRHLWCNFGSQGVFCLDLDGNVVWDRDLGDMQTRNDFGEGASVAVFGDTVVVPWDHEGESFLFALDALTGAERWKVARDEPTSWSTPRIVQQGDSVQVICNGTRWLCSYDLKSGELLWKCAGRAANPIPTPQILNGVAYCMTGYRGASIQAISLDGRGDLTGGTSVLWDRSDVAPYVPTGTLYNGTLYYTKGNEAIISATDAATGQPVFGPERIPGMRMIYASLVAAGGHVYICSREGEVVVARHGSKFDIVHSTSLGESIDATPALAGGQLLIRGEQSLFCFER